MGNRTPPLRPPTGVRSTFVLLAAVAAPPVIGVLIGGRHWLSLSWGLVAPLVILWLWRNMSHAAPTVDPEGSDRPPLYEEGDRP